MGNLLEEVEAKTESLFRPTITGATIIYHRSREEDGRNGLHIEAEEADKLFTEFDTGIIKGNSVFKTYAIINRKDNPERKMFFVNMINVEDVIFHTTEDAIKEDDE